MFVYRPPKGSGWGHSLGKDPNNAKQKLDAFFDVYFERAGSVLAWKSSVLPKIDWAEAFQGAENEKVRQFLFMVMGDTVMFPMGVVFPLSSAEPSTFEFLGRFCAAAPFKMSAKHFQVGVVGKNGSFAWRKPDADIAAKLEAAVG